MSDKNPGAEIAYSIAFSAQQLMMISSALSEMPFKHAAPLLQHIQRQVDEIEAAKVEKSAEGIQ